jgi:hypothetical protein
MSDLKELAQAIRAAGSDIGWAIIVAAAIRAVFNK